MVARDEQRSAQWSLNALVQAAKEADIAVKRTQIRTILLREGMHWHHSHSWNIPRDEDARPKGWRSSATRSIHPKARRPSAPMNSEQSCFAPLIPLPVGRPLNIASKRLWTTGVALGSSPTLLLPYLTNAALEAVRKGL
jgi:hypothetical protein